MSQIQLTDFALDEPSLTLWHCGRVCVNELAMDGVLEKEGAKIQPIRRAGLHSGSPMVLCKRKHGITTEVRDTNIRFSMIITTPANRCQKVGAVGKQLSKKSRTQLQRVPFVRHKSQSPAINRLFYRRQFRSEVGQTVDVSEESQRTRTSSHFSPFPAETARSLLLPLFTHSAVQISDRGR